MNRLTDLPEGRKPKSTEIQVEPVPHSDEEVQAKAMCKTPAVFTGNLKSYKVLDVLPTLITIDYRAKVFDLRSQTPEASGAF